MAALERTADNTAYWEHRFYEERTEARRLAEVGARYAAKFNAVCVERDALLGTLHAVSDEARRDTEDLHREVAWLKRQLRELGDHNERGEREARRKLPRRSDADL